LKGNWIKRSSHRPKDPKNRTFVWGLGSIDPKSKNFFEKKFTKKFLKNFLDPKISGSKIFDPEIFGSKKVSI